MLRLLRIRDFALIREVEIEFGAGLNLLTGETGSGKSIIIDALGSLLGARTAADMIRTGCESAVIEGIFDVDPEGRLQSLLAGAGAAGAEELLVRREISASGRGRVHINGSLASLNLLKSLGEDLADIHGQQDQHALRDLAAHLEWLDHFGGNDGEAGEVRRHHKALKELQKRLEALQMDEQERVRRADIIRFQLEEIRCAQLRPDEKEELDRERRILVHRERLFSLASEAHAMTYESENAVIGQLKRLERILQELEAIDPGWAAHREVARDSVYKFEDLAYSLRDYTSGTEFSPEQLERIEKRLAELEKLTRKYGGSIKEALSFAERCERELDELTSSDDTARMLTQELESELRLYESVAGRLSKKRRREAARLEREVRREFRSLALEKMRLEVRFHSSLQPVAGARIPDHFGPAGIDRIEFMIMPNVGEEMKPLARIASGGELSRIMLGIKVLCGGADREKTLIFDEVDSGIGGRVAEAVGRRLHAVAQAGQVLCVTHVPQIAAFADNHFCVAKQVVGSRTETFVQLLRGKGRDEEIARMMGGEKITETTRRHARELVEAVRQSTPGDDR